MKSDIYGVGITLWEMTYRCIKGQYQRPFAEHKHIMFDYQIIVQVRYQLTSHLSLITFSKCVDSCWLNENFRHLPEIWDQRFLQRLRLHSSNSLNLAGLVTLTLAQVNSFGSAHFIIFVCIVLHVYQFISFIVFLLDLFSDYYCQMNCSAVVHSLLRICSVIANNCLMHFCDN